MDIVVTVPKGIWTEWVEEGDAAGDPPSGEEWGYWTSGGRPKIEVGERVYIVAHDRLRGHAPLTKLVVEGRRVGFGRRGGAVAVTIPEPIRGFRGWRYRWWDRATEAPFQAWRTEGVGV
jgi:hypothetical protein